MNNTIKAWQINKPRSKCSWLWVNFYWLRLECLWLQAWLTMTLVASLRWHWDQWKEFMEGLLSPLNKGGGAEGDGPFYSDYFIIHKCFDILVCIFEGTTNLKGKFCGTEMSDQYRQAYLTNMVKWGSKTTAGKRNATLFFPLASAYKSQIMFTLS